MYPAYARLEQGVGVAEAFRETGAFSPILMDMVATGETSGNLDQMMTKVAEYYEDEAATRSMQLAQVVGVCLGLAVAIYIGYIVINFYTGYGAQVTSATQG
jgi:type II secretory pathway component PulF